MSYKRVGGEVVWKGGMIDVRRDRFEYDDGEEVTREIVDHPGAVAVVAHDGERVYLVAQPRESVDEQELLELPAGKLDEEGESPLETAQRELGEEVGLDARKWELLTTCYSSPGVMSEEVHVYLATDLYESDAERDESERIEVRPVPLAELQGLIAECRDMKTLVGLLWLKTMLD
jgi:ADP-ribose pyrophosphatase